MKVQFIIESTKEGYDLRIGEKTFSQLWQEKKTESRFDWATHSKKNNPYEAKDYGAALDVI